MLETRSVEEGSQPLLPSTAEAAEAALRRTAVLQELTILVVWVCFAAACVAVGLTVPHMACADGTLMYMDTWLWTAGLAGLVVTACSMVAIHAKPETLGWRWYVLLAVSSYCIFGLVVFFRQPEHCQNASDGMSFGLVLTMPCAAYLVLFGCLTTATV